MSSDPAAPIRNLEPGDYDLVAPVIDAWCGGRPVRGLLPRLFFEHFNTTSFAIGPKGTIQAFLVGFQSQSQPGVAYIHFVGVDPALRAQGLARRLYTHFAGTVSRLGCSELHGITSPANVGSIAFHRSMGFELVPGTGVVDGLPVVLDHGGPGQHRVLFRKRL